MDKNGRTAGKKAGSAVRMHIVCLVCFVLCFVMCVSGAVVRGVAKRAYSSASLRLNNVSNLIEQGSISVGQQVERVVKPLEGGLDKARWASDDAIIAEWIYPAFNFDDADEYNRNREIYVERLGNADDFVREVLPPYIPESSVMKSEQEAINDGKKINLHIANGGFKSYVDGFDGDVYSYVAVVTCYSVTTTGYSQQRTQDIILTYSINGKGQVVDFHAATPNVRS